jgi:hypothetical protein
MIVTVGLEANCNATIHRLLCNRATATYIPFSSCPHFCYQAACKGHNSSNVVSTNSTPGNIYNPRHWCHAMRNLRNKITWLWAYTVSSSPFSLPSFVELYKCLLHDTGSTSRNTRSVHLHLIHNAAMLKMADSASSETCKQNVMVCVLV